MVNNPGRGAASRIGGLNLARALHCPIPTTAHSADLARANVQDAGVGPRVWQDDADLAEAPRDTRAMQPGVLQSEDSAIPARSAPEGARLTGRVKSDITLIGGRRGRRGRASKAAGGRAL